MLIFLAVEIFACAATVMEKNKWTTVVYHDLKTEMEASIRLYDNTTANANMWNEIQHEVILNLCKEHSCLCLSNNIDYEVITTTTCGTKSCSR